MKKKILLILGTALLLTAAVTGCAGSNFAAAKPMEAMKHSIADAKTDSFDSLEELESAAELVVKAEKLPEEENVITRSQDTVVSSYTFSKVKIKTIYKAAGPDMKEGDILTILENQAKDEENNVIYHVAGYNMMVRGCDYLLFLKEASRDGKKYYVSLGVNYGTVSLSPDGRDKAYAETGEEIKDYYKDYEEIWEAARKRYA